MQKEEREKMKILNSFKTGYDILIVNPNLHISTKWAFQNLNYQEGFEKEKLLHNLITFNPGLKMFLKMILRRLYFQKYSLLGEIKKIGKFRFSVCIHERKRSNNLRSLRKNDSASILKCRNNLGIKNIFTFISD